VSETKIARVYAGALYEAATETDRLEPVLRDLTAFVDAVEAVAELQAVFLDEKLPVEEKKRLLMELTDGGEELVRNFLRILVDKGRESILSEMHRLFVERMEAAEGLVRVEMVTAVPVPDSLRDEIFKTLETSLATKVELALVVDEGLIGGIRLRVGDRIADASVRHRLDQLRARLVSPTVRLEGTVEAAS